MGPDCSASCGGWKEDVGGGGSALKPEGCQGSTRDDGRPDEVMMVVEGGGREGLGLSARYV